MISKCYAEKGEILMKEQLYTLTPTQNKRELIIKNNKIIDSKPYTINNNKDIIQNTTDRYIKLN
jgi:hypothetical protein